MKQLDLLRIKTSREFGGSLLKGKRKVARPLTFKKPMHFVIKATDPNKLLLRQSEIWQAATRMNKRFGVKQYKLAIHADHIHLVVRLHNRELYKKWIRSLTSLLVQKIPGLSFALRPYSLIMSWGRQFKAALNYLDFNQAEGDLMFYAYQRTKLYRDHPPPAGETPT